MFTHSYSATVTQNDLSAFLLRLWWRVTLATARNTCVTWIIQTEMDAALHASTIWIRTGMWRCSMMLYYLPLSADLKPACFTEKKKKPIREYFIHGQQINQYMCFKDDYYPQVISGSYQHAWYVCVYLSVWCASVCSGSWWITADLSRGPKCCR